MRKNRLIILLVLVPLTAAGQTLRLPSDKLGKPVLFGSRIVDVNRTGGKVFAPGQRSISPALMEFRLDSTGNAVLLPAGFKPHPNEGRRMQKGRMRHDRPIHLPVIGRDADGCLLLDVSEAFSTYPEQASAIPPKMLESDRLVDGRIVSTRETPDYLQVTGIYRYSSGLEVTAACYLLFLREDKMPERPVLKYYYSLEYRKPDGRKGVYSQRWDLSRRSTIDFYVDKAFPESWYPYIKEGLEDWNKAFEAAGLGKVVSVHPEPDDESFDRYSPLVNMVRYMDVEEANAKGDVLCDPRSGEILQGDILWWKNVVDLITGWRYVQTGAADPMARLKEYPLEMLGPMIRHSVCHEMGHVLGLNHNLGASWSYPTDSLRSPSFTREYGTSASVMDYARYNHLASAEDVEAGVNLLPPRLGPYDYYAIACGYGDGIPEETEYCYYAPMISAAISPDPSAQAESLGNDLLASSKAGIRNCKALLELDGLDEGRTGLLRKYYYRYLWLSLSNIGGKVDGEPVPWKLQKKTLIFVSNGLTGVPPALKDLREERRILDELDGNFLPDRVLKNSGPDVFKAYVRKTRRIKNKSYH